MNAASLQTQPAAELDHLSQLAEDVIARAKVAGASQVEVSASVDTGLSVNVRMGETETVERTQDRGFALTVYFGKRKGAANTADLRAESIQATIDQACAIARYTEEDSYAGLAEADRMATTFPALDLWHPWQPSVEDMIAIGKRIEDAGRAISGITNSEGASVSSGASLGIYANSHGFIGREMSTRHTMSCSLIAGIGNDMQRDYWYDSARSIEQWMGYEELGREAARRTLARCGGRTLSTRRCPVLFVPMVARGLISHLVSAVSGGALYRRSSFLLDHVGKQVLPNWFELDEQPYLKRGLASSHFDAEGVTPAQAPVVREGILQRYLLGTYAARRLGLRSTGNAGGPTNLVVGHGEDDFEAMLKRLDTGLLVTDVMGQGVSILTGDYSRGASGFWVENGQIAYPVQEITVAANLRDMFAGMRAVGADVDRRSSILTGSILIDRMTVAGE